MGGVAWRKLLLSTLHIVRSSNKTISDEAKETLDTLHGITLSVGGLMQNLEEILVGPRGVKGSSAGSASNSSKVVKWLNSLLRKEFHILLARSLGIAAHIPTSVATSNSSSPDYTTSSDATTASTTTPSPRPLTARTVAASCGQFFEKIDTSAGCQKAKHLLWHREEITRESAVHLIASFLSIDALAQVGDNSVGNVSSSGSYTGGLFTIARQLSRRLSTQAAGGKGSVFSIVTNCLSPGCKAVLVEIEKSAPRMYEKVLIAAANMIVDSTGAFSPSDAHIQQQPTSARGTKSMKSPRSEKASSKSNVRNGRHSSEAKQTYTSPPSSSTANPLDAVSGLWFEATLVLKHTPRTEEDWKHLTTVTRNSKNFFDQMTKSAVSGGIPRGSLLQIVLPFDNVTSLSDQADTSHMTPLKSVPGIPDNTLVTLREQAVTLRKLIRVKMADEADLNQAQMAVTTLDNLITSVSKIEMPLMEVLRGLK